MRSCLVPTSLIFALLTIGTLRSFALAEQSAPRPPDEPVLTEKDRAHWAFHKPTWPPLPAVRDASWVHTEVDAFILARLEKLGLQPAPPADRATLLRRVTLDLTGLPPLPAECDEFIHDTRPDAYERVVDRLLGSPHYGERWAQHWLDVVRYAESNGYEVDGQRPDAWRYRDYVIAAFNADLAYDRFVTEQLAGDLLPSRPTEQSGCSSPDRLIATGFNRCGPVHLVSGNTDPEINRQEVLTEMASGVAAAFLGLTVGCARCHDHKFDPISQADYYRLQAFFAATQPKDVDIATAADRTAHQKLLAAIEAQRKPLEKQVAELEAPYRARLTEAKKAKLEPIYRHALAVQSSKRTPEQKKRAEQAQVLIKVTWDELLGALTPEDRARRAAWRAQIHALEAQKPPPPAHAWAVAEAEKCPPTYVLHRGDPKRKGAQVEPGFLRILGENDLGRPAHTAKQPALPQPRLTRLDLARWLTSPEHPLTARVLVNRLWQHHFGRGLVATPNDFGVRGEAPSHPELLDWLACEFIDHGWSIKHIHRLLVLSNTYQQTSRLAPSALAKRVDPDNRLLWRMNRWRLEGESLRDSILAVAGSLNPALGGPMVFVPLEPEVYELIFTEGEPDGLWPVTPDLRAHSRRSIYLFAKRNVRLPLLEAFDRPDSLTSCAVRPVSTFAPQALILLNGPFLQAQSKVFAARLLGDGGSNAADWIDRAYRLALARPPRAAELRMAQEFLATQEKLIRERLRRGEPVRRIAALPETLDPAQAAAVADFCSALLNSNEFVYVP
ncbi:MAG TPA: DUF1549 and DUF1553 domain-containing protein [Gemmataceae bacterium]|nr:DUF1549 and DUF1553 domain-containing protein [Gemmataceae bacterium]